MAVWTQVSNQALDAFLQNYSLGRVLAFKAIAEGVENSNYFLQTETGDFILTLYEKRVAEKDLPFFLGLMNHLKAQGLSVATALQRTDGKLYGQLANRPAAVISFLRGRWMSEPSLAHCRLFGEVLARLHEKASTFKQTRENKMGAPYWQDLLDNCLGIESNLKDTIQKEITALHKQWEHLPTGSLPRGIIHGDCFPDNVLFDGDKISVIDFYFACEEFLALDIAICLNAWSWQGNRWHRDRAAALLAGYSAVRALTPNELACLPLLCRASALRFLLTRLADKLQFEKLPSAAVVPKDPKEYLALLAFHQAGGKLYD